MRRMDEGGGAYGEDPYGDAGHAYAYGYEYGAGIGVGTDTGTMSRNSVELAQWTHSEYSTHATGTPVIPAGGYVTLLVSTMLGGPGSSSPFVPQSDSTHPTTPRATAPDASPGTGHSAGTESHRRAAELRPRGAEDPRSHRPVGRLHRSCGHVRAAVRPLRQSALYGRLPQPSPHPGFRQPGPSKTPQLY
ncbi:hypothetical protein [Streptomyces mirabilis]|uniref:hypothetical protein n=1 Tax=Streptomyces mirabilis TaxID=68239 RepID=UPI0036E10A81